MSTNSRGFTLVEVLVIAPVVILFIGIFVGLLVNLTGESLMVREKNLAAFDAQASLDSIETSVAQATAFLTTTGTLPSAQGKEDYVTTTPSTAAFSNTNVNGFDALITESAATDKNPTDPARSIIYTGTGSCDSKNPLYTYMTIYFIAADADTADTTDNALYKRTIVPQTPACAGPWQRNSCNPANKSANPATCKASDEKLASGVSTFNVKYYVGSNTTEAGDANARSATDVSVDLTLAKQAAGKAITQNGSTRTNSVNVQSADTTGGGTSGGPTAPPANPPIAYSRNGTGPAPYDTTFSWGRVNSASYYNFRYNFNGGPWTQVRVDNPWWDANLQPSFTVNGTQRKQAVNVQVDVVSSVGTYSYGNSSATATPNWNDCGYQSGWTGYGAPYGEAGFTRTSAGVVSLNGLIKKATTPTQYEVICNLPAGFRPSSRLIYAPATSGTTVGRIDIETNGDVIYVHGSNAWLSLNGISFLASGTQPWSDMTALNSWVTYGSPYPTPQVAVDSTGRVHVQGLAKNGITTAGTTAFGYASSIGGMDGTDIYPARGPAVGSMQLNNNKTIAYRGSGGNGYWSLQAMFYPSGTTTWSMPALAAGWVNYSATRGYNFAQYTKNADGIVSLGGLIKNGTVTSGTVLFTLPAGYWPTNNIICSEVTNPDAFARVDVATNGQVILREGVNTGWLSLAGCDFPID